MAEAAESLAAVQRCVIHDRERAGPGVVEGRGRTAATLCAIADERCGGYKSVCDFTL